MKKNEKSNLRGMKTGELEKKLHSMQESLRAIKLKAEGARSKNVKEQASIRKDIARVMTFMKELNSNQNA